MEDIKILLDTAREEMDAAIIHLEKILLGIRAGKANPIMLDAVMVDYYGAPTPLKQVANVNSADARTLSIQPWEKQIISNIEKAIIEANLGFNPINKGDVILINIPPLTEERRKELVKQTKHEGEEAKISIRNARQEANKEIKKLEIAEDMKAQSSEDVQKITDEYTKKVDGIIAVKEKEILTV